jgi:membrane-associated phospholipid phosphatase
MFRKPGMRMGIDILSVLIILSTVFIKQHSILDVAGGLILFIIADKLVTVYAYNRGLEPAPDKSKV